MNLPTDQTIQARVEKISQGGQGIARYALDPVRGGIVVFIPYSVPDDLLKVQVQEVKKNFARGRILEIVQPGAGRMDAPCPYFFSPSREIWCGGCSFQQMDYDRQKAEKIKMLRETLEKLSGQKMAPFEPALGESSGQWRYRNKIQIPFARAENGNAICGFYQPGTHRVQPIDDCLIHPQRLVDLARFVRDRMNAWKLPAYEDATHEGWLRHLVARRQDPDGRILAVFVTASSDFPRAADWIKEVLEHFPEVIGIYQNVNPDRTNVILGKQWKRLWGEAALVESLSNLAKEGSALRLRISAESFFQVNTQMAQRLYQTARDFAMRQPALERRLLLDLYCGVGGIALSCASSFERVIGVEESESSIGDARFNARENGFQNCEFVHAGTESFLKGFSVKKGPVSVVVVDPPRAGCADAVIQALLRIKPERIVYVSCDPASLARDLKLLCSRIYRIEAVQPVDLFPQTAHLESVTLLVRHAA